MQITELEGDLATRSGFAARVVPPAGLRNVGYFIAILGLLAAGGAVVQGRSATDAVVALGVFVVPALVVVALGLLVERGRLRPLQARYRARGWVSVQVPCGLVEDSSGDSSLVRRSRELEGQARDDATPIVLVGGRGQSAPDVESAAAAGRDALAQLGKDEAWGLAQRVWAEGLRRNRDAATFLPVPRGMLLTVRQGHSPYVLVVPPADRGRGRRPRYYAIRSD